MPEEKLIDKEVSEKDLDNTLNFICYLIDNCEGEEITEEYLQRSLLNFIESSYFKKSNSLPDAPSKELSARELLEKVSELKSNLILAKEEIAAIQHTVVTTVNGAVEGSPTHEGNYLQRLRELVQIEKDFARISQSIANAKKEGVRKFLNKVLSFECKESDCSNCLDGLLCGLSSVIGTYGIDEVIKKVEGL